METVKRTLLGLLIMSLCAAVLGQEKSVKEGDNVEFPCNYASSYPASRIEWKYFSGPDMAFIYYNGSMTTSYRNRAQFYPKGLTLRDVTRRDMGEYVCEVTDTTSGTLAYTQTKTQLVVLVPPSVPIPRVPSSATIGSSVTLYCDENDASPRPTFTWYKNNIKMPEDPKTSPTFQNYTYTLNPTTGELTFNPVTQLDSGEYSCEVSNGQGLIQRSANVFMEAYEKNVGGIVAAVIIVLLILGLIAFGLWFAYSRGYIGKKTNKKVIYSQPSETRSDKNFQQTSSFVV